MSSFRTVATVHGGTVCTQVDLGAECMRELFVSTLPLLAEEVSPSEVVLQAFIVTAKEK